MKNYIHKVKYYETDRMGITHHSNYIRFMEEARIDFMEQLGYGYDKMEADGIGSPVVSLQCHYKHSTTFPDVIEISVHIEELKSIKLVLGYTMTVDGKIVCTGESTHCFLNESGSLVKLNKELPAFYERLCMAKKESTVED
ncbi:MAG: acyl-CoA thioesterase [Clostridiales bacterium]|nr:acyl-CoA thioesterase [Clostridiales bacterium]